MTDQCLHLNSHVGGGPPHLRVGPGIGCPVSSNVFMPERMAGHRCVIPSSILGTRFQFIMGDHQSHGPEHRFNLERDS